MQGKHQTFHTRLDQKFKLAGVSCCQHVPSQSPVMSLFIYVLNLLILLLRIRLNSSTSIMKNLTPEESFMHIAASNVANFAALTGTYLVGYYSDIFYTDAACSVVQYAESYQLNVCYPWTNGFSYITLSNGTHVISNRYDDYSCTGQPKIFTMYNDFLRVCGAGYRTISVTTSFSTITSSAPLLSVA